MGSIYSLANSNLIYFIAVIFAVLTIVSILKKMFKIAALVLVICLVVAYGGQELDKVKSKYNVNVKDGVISYTIDGKSNNIKAAEIEKAYIVSNGDTKKVEFEFKSGGTYEVELPKIAYDVVVKNVLEKAKISIE